MKFIAHRGLWGKQVKENSYEAIKNGLESNKYIGIETDVRVTKDNIFIIYHDILYKGKLVKNVLYKDIKKDAIRLKDVLSIKTSKIILLEIKDFNINVNKLIKLIDKYNSNVYIMSFDNRVIKRIKNITNKYKLGVLNYILNSESNYDLDFICILDVINSEVIMDSFKKRGIDVIIYGVNKVSGDYTYIIDDCKIKGN